MANKEQFAIRLLKHAADVYVCVCGPANSQTEDGRKVKTLVDDVAGIVSKANALTNKKKANKAKGKKKKGAKK